LHDVDLGRQIGGDIHRRIGDQQRARIGRHIHQKNVADAPVGAQAVGLVHHFAYQLVGVQGALHQRLEETLACQRDAGFRRGVTVRHVEELAAGEIQLELLGQRADALLRPD
jgi:hypothetical protein